PGQAARAITALSALRDQVIGPIVAGVRVPRQGRPPKAWTRVDRDYEALRIGMQALFDDLGTSPGARPWPHEQLFVDAETASG
ncbi:MAG: hypothetical protein ACRDHM_01535, partial [Actinomycetota bacterium]